MKTFTAAVIFLFLVSGCGATTRNGSESDVDLTYKTITTESGVKVECVVYNGNREASISCDWDGARR